DRIAAQLFHEVLVERYEREIVVLRIARVRGIGRRAVATAPGDELVTAPQQLFDDFLRVGHLREALTVRIAIPPAPAFEDPRRAIVEEVGVEGWDDLV